MPTMQHLLEQLQARLNEVSTNEQALLRTLRDALNRADDKLLREVRTISAEHDTRRRAVLAELQSLAARVGELPAPREPVPELVAHAQNGERPENAVEESLPRSISRYAKQKPNAANITAELDLYFKARAS